MAEGGGLSYVGNVKPDSACQEIVDKSEAYLVDVRTLPEWTFVGLPDLSAADKSVWRIEWKSFPEMTHNPRFFAQLAEAVTVSGAESLYFLCRSGARSHDAAKAALTAPEMLGLGKSMTFFNVEEGFEGDLDPKTGQRGALNGWKARGLPWRQS